MEKVVKFMELDGKPEAGWKHEADIPGKEKAMLAYDAKGVRPLALPIRYVDGKITLQMLKSYANVGEVVVWMQKATTLYTTETPPVNQSAAAAVAAPVVADCGDEAGLARIATDVDDVLGVWRGTNFWTDHFSLATDVDVFYSLPQNCHRAAHAPEATTPGTSTPPLSPPPVSSAAADATANATASRAEAAEKCVSETTLFICPRMSRETGSAKIKLFDVRAT